MFLKTETETRNLIATLKAILSKMQEKKKQGKYGHNIAEEGLSGKIY